MKIAVAGAGYVGLSNAILMAQYNRVVLYEPNEEKVKNINKSNSPIVDSDIFRYLKSGKLNLIATTDQKHAYCDADYVFVATPTNYDECKKEFDTSTVENVINDVRRYSQNAVIVIKSTVPIGFTSGISQKLKDSNIYFSPEFLREGMALHDCLYPTRIIVGYTEKSHKNTARDIASLLKNGAVSEVTTVIMGTTEAEAVKLFANTYLAMRVSFFNELDNYAELKGLNTQEIIMGVGLDPRIGDYYNNPSFGYGGYCLPKDTKQLLADYNDVPQNLISAIVASNDTRKEHIVTQVLNRNPKTVGVYRLTMKSKSDNFREASIQDVMRKLSSYGIRIIIFEPMVLDDVYMGYEVVSELEQFAEKCDVIIANRLDEAINPFLNKVYTRDLYMNN